MKKLIFSTFNFAPSFAGVMLNELQCNAEGTDEVFFVTCSRSFNRCGFNLYGLKYACDLCEYRLHHALPLVDGKFNRLRLEELINDEDVRAAESFTASLKNIDSQVYYKTFDVGDSVLSSYISKTRDKDLTQDRHYPSLKELTGYAAMVYSAVTRFIREQGIEEVILFNGRWDYYRAVLRAAQEANIRCRVVENFRSGGYIEVFDSSFPHSIKNKQLNFDTTWNAAGPTEAEKVAIGSQFFERKRNGEVIVDKSYTGMQQKNQLPEGIDRSKKLVVIFNSSDDEFAAVGAEYKNPFFTDQSEGITWLVHLFGKELTAFELVVRMHPNLLGIQYGYAQDLYALAGLYPNVHIIKPESKVDSYALMAEAYKIITFGSSIGVESTYWKKPVILLAKAFYSLADVAHVPASRDDIRAMIERDLEPKPQLHAIKVGYYFLRGGVKAPHYDYEYKKKYFFKGVRIDVVPKALRLYFKILKTLKFKNRKASFLREKR